MLSEHEREQIRLIALGTDHPCEVLADMAGIDYEPDALEAELAKIGVKFCVRCGVWFDERNINAKDLCTGCATGEEE